MHRRITFAGVDAPQSLPTGYERLQRRHGAEITSPNYTLADVLAELESEYDVEWRDLFHPAQQGDGAAGQSVENYRCLVNPAWVNEDPDDLPGDRKDAVWHIPTRSYTRVPHHDAFEPLLDALRQRGDADRIYGTVRLRQDGGEAHIDMFHRDAGVDPDGAGAAEDITLGISTGQDYLGGTRLYVGTVAYHDTGDGVGQIMRDITDAQKRKHTGNAGQQVVDWYATAVDRLDKVGETLYQTIGEAMNYEVPMPEIPCSLTQFYEHLGLANKKPNNLADAASQRAVQTATGPYTAYHLYKAGTWAVEHEYDSRDTKRFRENVEAVNTLLFNPALAERRVLSEVEDELEDADDDASIFDFTDEDPEATIDSVRERAESISDGVEQFRSNREKLRKLLEDEGVEVDA